MNSRAFSSFWEFYPFYLEQHRHPVCRALHFIGSVFVLLQLAWITISGSWGWWWTIPLIGYGFAWIGHFFFEKNRPATFQYPWYSLMGDWVMFW
ncbi:Mpo1-like protein [Shewanella sp. GXUN23E]|uniref:Mpo1-like protein n=1 Tax=Shewanella sp. GXUN23E TaxID=3422498 RepID=UPI003D7C8B11